MKTSQVTTEDIARAVWAVPPLAWKDGRTEDAENGRLVRHIEAGGVSTILWGGNANIYGLNAEEFSDLVQAIPEWVAPETWAIPSVGPDYGKLREHARALAKSNYPAALLLPYAGPRDASGVEWAVRDFVQASGMPAILYIRQAEYLPADRIAALFADGTLAAVKYAVETGDFSEDPYLDKILSEAPHDRIVSGIGEIAGIAHLSAFPLAGFTAGIVCIAPRRAMSILRAAQMGNQELAVDLSKVLRPLEDLREHHGPIPVIHSAVTLAGVADMGVIGPHFSPVSKAIESEIKAAVEPLLAGEQEMSLAG